MFSNENILKNYADFFKMWPFKVEETKLQELLTEGHNKKANARKVFDMGDDGRMVVHQMEVTGETLPTMLETLFSRTFTAVCHTLDSLSSDLKEDEKVWALDKTKLAKVMVYNALPSGQKFSRWYLGFVNSNPRRKDTSEQNLHSNKVYRELPGVPMHKQYNTDQIVQSLYSELAKIKDTTLKVILSFNPYDILNASTGYITSCNAPHESFGRSPVSVLLSNRSGILMLKDSRDILLGRAYISFAENGNSFITYPPYGILSQTLYDKALSAIAAWLDAKFGGTQWKVISTVRTRAVTLFHPRSIFSHDEGPKLCHRIGAKNLAHLELGEAKCVVCGTIATKNSSDTRLVCMDCRRNHQLDACHMCGKYFKDTFVEGPVQISGKQPCCPSCAEKLNTCEICGRKYEKKCSCKNVAPCILCGLPLEVAYATQLIPGVFAHQNCMVSRRVCKSCGIKLYAHGDYCEFCKQNKETSVEELLQTFAELDKEALTSKVRSTGVFFL